MMVHPFVTADRPESTTRPHDPLPVLIAGRAAHALRRRVLSGARRVVGAHPHHAPVHRPSHDDDDRLYRVERHRPGSPPPIAAARRCRSPHGHC